MKLSGLFLCLAVLLGVFGSERVAAQDTTATDTHKALIKAVDFFHKQVAVEGGYVYLVSSDLKFREGEGVADAKTVWVQPPGTPAVGLAILTAYLRTQDNSLLEAAKDAGRCLVRGQLASGGWQAHIDFGPELRPKMAYRVDSKRAKKARNLSTFDDDKTQSAVRFLAELDRALKFQDAKIHEATLFAIDSILKNQFPNGAWGQVYETLKDPEKYPVVKANYPKEWPREFPGGDYWVYYTINDNNISRTIDTLLLVAEIYNEPRYRQAAIKAADFFLLAQMPEPQPAWAQQYNFEMQPVWARKFEPPAVSGGESQQVIESLMDIYVETGDRKYLEPLPRALDYLQRSQLPNGRIARFYELQTNKPLYFTKDYKLTYSSDDMPTHYSFISSSSVSKLRANLDKLANLTETQLQSRREASRRPREESLPSPDQIKRIISSMDDRGAWVEPGKLRYHKGQDQVNQIIRSETFIRNITQLSRYASKP
ncbi:MAG: pectate lyase [Pirellula sp.]